MSGQLPRRNSVAVERLATAEEVASVVRHDVRNALSSVRNAAFFIQRTLKRTEGLELDPRVARFFDLIAAELDRADALLTDGLNLRSLHGADARPVRLHGLVARMVDGLPQHEASRITTDLQDVDAIEANEDELTLLVSCLLDNALESGPETRVVICTRQNGMHILLGVQDDGPGLAGPSRDALRPLQSTKAGHVGLGLNFVVRIARRYSGTLTLVAGSSADAAPETAAQTSNVAADDDALGLPPLDKGVRAVVTFDVSAT